MNRPSIVRNLILVGICALSGALGCLAPDESTSDTTSAQVTDESSAGAQVTGEEQPSTVYDPTLATAGKKSLGGERMGIDPQPWHGKSGSMDPDGEDRKSFGAPPNSGDPSPESAR